MKGEEIWKKERKGDPLLKKPPKREAISSPRKTRNELRNHLSSASRLLDIQTSPSSSLLINVEERETAGVIHYSHPVPPFLPNQTPPSFSSCFHERRSNVVRSTHPSSPTAEKRKKERRRGPRANMDGWKKEEEREKKKKVKEKDGSSFFPPGCSPCPTPTQHSAKIEFTPHSLNLIFL